MYRDVDEWLLYAKQSFTRDMTNADSAPISDNDRDGEYQIPALPWWTYCIVSTSRELASWGDFDTQLPTECASHNKRIWTTVTSKVVNNERCFEGYGPLPFLKACLWF